MSGMSGTSEKVKDLVRAVEERVAAWKSGGKGDRAGGQDGAGKTRLALRKDKTDKAKPLVKSDTLLILRREKTS